MEKATAGEALSVDVISDVVCPWCFIGKRHLEAALELWRRERPHDPLPRVRWHPFQLNPGLPREGIPRQQYVADKFGSPERAREIYARVAHAGTQAGIQFRFDAIERQPNTVDAHRLVMLADERGVQDAMVEALFQAYFLEGADLTRADTLAGIASRAGIDAAEAAAHLAGESGRLFIENEDHRARMMGVAGVPFFIFGHKYAVSGAQPPEVLFDAMRRTVEDSAGSTAA